MKLRKVVIGVESVEQWAGAINRTLRRASSGQRIKAGERLYFENAAALRKFFSDRRLELLRAIRHHHPRSIKELATLVGRDFKNVNADVHYLVQLGLAELETESGSAAKGRKAPRVACDEIELHIPL
jgi:predicted transcriptional regulator